MEFMSRVLSVEKIEYLSKISSQTHAALPIYFFGDSVKYEKDI